MVAVVEHILRGKGQPGFDLTQGEKVGYGRPTFSVHQCYIQVHAACYQCGKLSIGPRCLEMFITTSVDMLGASGHVIVGLVP